jgi:excisionase family DNA binding protein
MDNIIENSGQPAHHGRLLTIEEVAAYMQASPRHVANLVRRREIPFIKLGALTRFDLDEVKAALAHLTVNAR